MSDIVMSVFMHVLCEDLAYVKLLIIQQTTKSSLY